MNLINEFSEVTNKKRMSQKNAKDRERRNKEKTIIGIPYNHYCSDTLHFQINFRRCNHFDDWKENWG